MSLELGGKSPHLVFESADLEQGELPFPCFLLLVRFFQLCLPVETRGGSFYILPVSPVPVFPLLWISSGPLGKRPTRMRCMYPKPGCASEFYCLLTQGGVLLPDFFGGVRQIPCTQLTWESRTLRLFFLLYTILFFLPLFQRKAKLANVQFIQ